ncbi:MAG: DUF1847 domain-containing protein [Eubacterium ramulus]
MGECDYLLSDVSRGGDHWGLAKRIGAKKIGIATCVGLIRGRHEN